MKKRINEGGNIFKNADGQPDTIRINRVDVEPTVQWLETITGLELTDFKLGTTGLAPSSGDIDLAQDFYLGNITKDDSKFQAKDFVKRVALSDGELKDKEVRFLVRMKQAWGYQYFD